MLSKGNGRPEICASNILLTVRGEVPYERLKGIDRAVIDRPAALAEGQISADVIWALETYEPRISAESVSLPPKLNKIGDFDLNVNLRT